ncbi:unnamed protein product [Brassicogethes aeneus]|uniref:Uncharacterized protein n=1 Tax=Brassicogethes aeneus TaxID=1431903 RepID=A0A9P0FIJ4_BRAAE|nr:unnamed protein product [Brassicogethes aeneus]
MPCQLRTACCQQLHYPSLGVLTLNLNFVLRRAFVWNFVIADVSVPILGSDFLAHFVLLPDYRNKRLIDSITGISTPCQSVSIPQVSIKAIIPDSPGNSILSEFPALICPAGTFREVHHSTLHYIKTTPGPPVSSHPRRLAPDHLVLAKAEFDAMLREGTARSTVQRVNGPYNMFPRFSA